MKWPCLSNVYHRFFWVFFPLHLAEIHQSRLIVQCSSWWSLHVQAADIACFQSSRQRHSKIKAAVRWEQLQQGRPSPLIWSRAVQEDGVWWNLRQFEIKTSLKSWMSACYCCHSHQENSKRIKWELGRWVSRFILNKTGWRLVEKFNECLKFSVVVLFYIWKCISASYPSQSLIYNI